MVDTDYCADGFVTLGLEELLKLEVEIVVREPGNINGGRAFFLLVGTISSVLLLTHDAHKHLLEAGVSGLTLSHIRLGHVRSAMDLLGSRLLLHWRRHRLVLLHSLRGLRRDILTHI